MMKALFKILFGLKIRYLLVSFGILIIILLAAGYISIHTGQEITLDSLIQQGKAFTKVLVASASNIIESDRQLTDLGVDNVIAEVNLVLKDAQFTDNKRLLETLIDQIGLQRAAVINGDKSILDEVKAEPRAIATELDSLELLFLGDINLTEPFGIIFDFYSVGDRRFFFAVLPYKQDLYLSIVYPWVFGRYADHKLSLAYLLNQLSRETGIEYIILQNLEGIVFASKQISQLDRIEDDPFLREALEADTASYRVIEFQDRKILEIVQTFNSGEEFHGLFRVGMSLFGYRQLTMSLQKQIWLYVAVLFILGIIGVVIAVGYQNLNITEDALNRANAIMQSLQDSIAGIVISTNENLKIVTANIEARKHFGLPEGPSQNWDYDEFFPDDPFQVRAALDEKRPRNFETQIKGSSGMIDLLVSTSPLHGVHGQPTGIIVVAHDISDKRALERQAQQSHRLSELGTVAAGLAHDIRNPLNAIGMVIQRLESEITVATGQEEFEEFLRTLRIEHTKLNAIIEKILQVARSSRLEMKEADIRPIINEVVALYQFEASEHNIEIQTDIDAGMVYLNEGAFKSIISNLIKNAIEAIGNEGRIAIKAYFGNGKLTVSVTDNGPGIADEQKRNLFKPFYTTKPGGTGLGLATAYKAAVDHSGDLKAESRVGGPTIFTLTIPVKRP